MSLYHVSTDDIPENPLTDKCIVLDLDETLVHSYEEADFFENLKIFSNPKALHLRNRVYGMILEDVVTEPGSGVETELVGILRPHAREFLIFCLSYFRIVCIWSAGKRLYVEEIVRILFGGLPQPNLIFAWDECEKGKGRIEKPLSKMFIIEGLENIMRADNTFVIDDRKDTFMEVNLNNGIVIPPYTPESSLKGFAVNDNSLIQLMNWFSKPEVIYSKDVRTLDKTNIFKLPLTKELDTKPIDFTMFYEKDNGKNKTIYIMSSNSPKRK